MTLAYANIRAVPRLDEAPGTPRESTPRMEAPQSPRVVWLMHLVESGALSRGGVLTRDVVDPFTGEYLSAEDDKRKWRERV